MEEKRKLNTIKYNKVLQEKIYINLLNYKILSGKYIIFTDDGKVREYNAYNDKLIFEGENVNGKKSGKVKEYYREGQLKFEGLYLNGRRNGKGKEYDKFSNLIFDGEYLNGLRNGTGNEYDEYGNLVFKGEYLNGKKWNGKGNRNKIRNEFIYEINDGKGSITEYDYNSNLLKFKGNYLNGERNGTGIEYDTFGNLKFKGEYLNGLKWNGKGYNIKNEIIYELKNGKGIIKEYYLSGNIKYEGEYLSGNKNGKGREYDIISGKLRYEGEYLNGNKNGKGKEYDDNGELKFEGDYFYDHKLKGKEYINRILEFEGEYLYDKKWNGKGYDKNGNIIYELDNGNGNVKEYTNRGFLIFEGEYLNGKRNGKGKEYKDNSNLNFEGENSKGEVWRGNENDELIFEGEYLNGKRWKGKGKEYYYNGKLSFEGEYLNGIKNGMEYDEDSEL